MCYSLRHSLSLCSWRFQGLSFWKQRLQSKCGGCREEGPRVLLLSKSAQLTFISCLLRARLCAQGGAHCCPYRQRPQVSFSENKQK